ncbi:hypothetical protein, partial [Actinomadura rupiterrae]|uniref:hypothetical protein n=1 Tax=Actinomadura rupiterrae TaxID=559627 RepID=UPI0020A314C2
RLVDAVIGVAVALLFSQLLLPAEPVAVLRRVERDALAHLAATVGLVTEGIHRADRKLTAEALSEMEETAFHLADLTDIRGASTRSAWLSPLHLRRLAAVKREVRHARRLELLSLSSLTLMRTILMPPPEERPTAHAVPHRFQQVLVTLSTDDGNAGALASGQMLDLVRSTAAATLHHEALNAVGAVLCLTAEDVLVYAGRGQREAAAIVRDAWREARTSHDTPDDAEGHDDRDA